MMAPIGPPGTDRMRPHEVEHDITRRFPKSAWKRTSNTRPSRLCSSIQGISDALRLQHWPARNFLDSGNPNRERKRSGVDVVLSGPKGVLRGTHFPGDERLDNSLFPRAARVQF